MNAQFRLAYSVFSLCVFGLVGISVLHSHTLFTRYICRSFTPDTLLSLDSGIVFLSDVYPAPL